MTTYSLLFENRSTNTSNIIVYQKGTNPSPEEYSLVWLDNTAHPQVNVQFQWPLDYGFVWGEPGDLKPGVIFNSSQIVEAEMGQSNAITLKESGGALEFTDPKAGPADGLLISNDPNVSSRSAGEGVAMAGRATRVVSAQPNMMAIFESQPEYWIAFGTFQSGEVLDPSYMFGADSLVGGKVIYGRPIQVVYPPGVFSMKAVLNADNSWTIEPA